MSRLLFAAARGARILNNKGKPVKYVWVWPEIAIPDFGVHIHPDDAHLQYGPISTALREVALTDDCDGADIPYIEVILLREDGHFHSTEDQRCVFLLILAEALADEGL